MDSYKTTDNSPTDINEMSSNCQILANSTESQPSLDELHEKLELEGQNKINNSGKPLQMSNLPKFENTHPRLAPTPPPTSNLSTDQIQAWRPVETVREILLEQFAHLQSRPLENEGLHGYQEYIETRVDLKFSEICLHLRNAITSESMIDQIIHIMKASRCLLSGFSLEFGRDVDALFDSTFEFLDEVSDESTKWMREVD